VFADLGEATDVGLPPGQRTPNRTGRFVRGIIGSGSFEKKKMKAEGWVFWQEDVRI
jgi:hypothetical protein